MNKTQKLYFRILGLILFFIIIDIVLFFVLKSLYTSTKAKFKPHQSQVEIIQKGDSILKEKTKKIAQYRDSLMYLKSKEFVKEFLPKSTKDTLKVFSKLTIPFNKNNLQLKVFLHYNLFSPQYKDTLKFINYSVAYYIYSLPFSQIRKSILDTKLNQFLQSRYKSISIELFIDSLKLEKL